MPRSSGSHIRQNTSLVAAAEKQLLIAMARRLPAWLNSDHLSLVALGSMAISSAGFAVMRIMPWGSLIVAAGLIGNWFGDSLDGTLARVRGHERPRFGYYVDHAIDLAGSVVLFAGLASSGLMSPVIAMAVLSGYLLVAAETFLATHATGIFRMASVGVGPTELRVVLIAGALFAALHPTVVLPLLGPQRLFDVGGAFALAGFVVVFAMSALRRTRDLYRMEPPPPAWAQPMSPSVRPSRIHV
jgi:phosphatidylglycerophosphate synthase